jgi:hypothetical protein
MGSAVHDGRLMIRCIQRRRDRLFSASDVYIMVLNLIGDQITVSLGGIFQLYGQATPQQIIILLFLFSVRSFLILFYTVFRTFLPSGSARSYSVQVHSYDIKPLQQVAKFLAPE